MFISGYIILNLDIDICSNIYIYIYTHKPIFIKYIDIYFISSLILVPDVYTGRIKLSSASSGPAGAAARAARAA